MKMTLRQGLDLYVCVSHTRYFECVPLHLKLHEQTHMVVFRKNFEDIYVGIETAAESYKAR